MVINNDENNILKFIWYQGFKRALIKIILFSLYFYLTNLLLIPNISLFLRALHISKLWFHTFLIFWFSQHQKSYHEFLHRSSPCRTRQKKSNLRTNRCWQKWQWLATSHPMINGDKYNNAFLRTERKENPWTILIFYSPFF